MKNNQFNDIQTRVARHILLASWSFTHRISTTLRLLLASSVLILFSGCTTVYKGTGDVLIKYAGDEAVPYLLERDDFQMVCAMSESFGPFMFSFERVTRSPDSLKVLFYMMSGQCAQELAKDEYLRYLRGVKSKDPLAAKDALIEEKRFLNLAAQRHYAGYQALVKSYVEPGGECPALKTFDDELYWLAGLLNGLQAVFADMKSEAAAKVPLDIAAKVARSSECLDNTKWWGVPQSIQAAVWAVIPGSGPRQADPLKMLKAASQVGERRRVRLAHIFEAEVYLGRGDIDKVKEIIRHNASLQLEKPADPAMKLFDHVAFVHLQSLSDQLWTEAVGHRTPWKEYGQFWDDQEEEMEHDELDIDELL